MRKILATALILAAGLLMGGCINMKVSTQVGEDGSGTWSFGFHFDEEAFAEMGSMFGADSTMTGTDTAGTDITSDMTGDLAGTFGDDLSQIVTDPETGIAISAEVVTENEDEEWIYFHAFVPNAEAWGSLEEVFMSATESQDGSESSSEMDLGMDPAASAGELPLFPTVTIDGDTVRVVFEGNSPAEAMGMGDLTGTDTTGLDTTGLDSTGVDTTALEGLGDMDAMAEMFSAMFMDSFSFQYVVTVPGSVTDTNGQLDTDSGSVTYDVDFTSTDPINFYVEATK